MPPSTAETSNDSGSRRSRQGAASLRIVIGLIIGFLAAPAFAGSVPFDDGWTHQRLSLFSRNDYVFSGPRVDVMSEDAISIVYRRLPPALWRARTAAWRWGVEETAPPTDLAMKGGDDRNLSLYVVFLPREDADRMKEASVLSLLDEDSARVLLYVWGGAHESGALIPSPYMGENGASIVLRPAGTGEFAEAVNLVKDCERAFGAGDYALVGLALSADSDDTDSRIRAWMADLRLD